MKVIVLLWTIPRFNMLEFYTIEEPDKLFDSFNISNSGVHV